MFWKHWCVIPKMLPVPWNQDAPDWRLPFSPVLLHLKNNLCRLQVGSLWHQIHISLNSPVDKAFPKCYPVWLECLASLMRLGLHWERDFREMTSENLFHEPKGTACSRDYSGSFCLAWVCPKPPCMPRHLEGKAPLQFCMGILLVFEILPSVTQHWVLLISCKFSGTTLFNPM